jgi:hypothetical protein
MVIVVAVWFHSFSLQHQPHDWPFRAAKEPGNRLAISPSTQMFSLISLLFNSNRATAWCPQLTDSYCCLTLSTSSSEYDFVIQKRSMFSHGFILRSVLAIVCTDVGAIRIRPGHPFRLLEFRRGPRSPWIGSARSVGNNKILSAMTGGLRQRPWRS